MSNQPTNMELPLSQADTQPDIPDVPDEQDPQVGLPDDVLEPIPGVSDAMDFAMSN